jgi:hypothetical protein
MKRTLLIRLSGLAAMVGGIIFGVRESLLGRPDEPPGLVPLFLLSEMVAIVALHLLHKGRERYGRGGALASVTAFVGVAFMAGGYKFIERISHTMFWGYMFIVGVLVAPIGILVLAIVTLDAGVLPRWGGWALIASWKSPPWGLHPRCHQRISLPHRKLACGSALGSGGLCHLPSSNTSCPTAFTGAVRDRKP